MPEPTDAHAAQTRIHELRNEVRNLKKYVDRSIDAAGQKTGESARRLTEAHEQTRRDLAGTKQKIDKLTDDLAGSDRRTEDRLDSLGRRLAKLDSRLDSLARTAEAIQREVELLNRKVRQIEAPGARAEIDSWAAGQTDLAAQVAGGREAARDLNAMAGLRTLRSRIDAHDQNLADHRARRDEAIAAARQLAELDPDAIESVWSQHMRAWTRNQQAVAELAARLGASQADADEAMAELQVHSQRTAELLPAIEQGEIAEGRLRERIRGYLETVVAADQFLPTWMEIPLGAGIPRKHWREWMDTAVGILLYRLVYRVPSPVDALGERPAEPGDQQAEYDRLTEAIGLHRT